MLETRENEIKKFQERNQQDYFDLNRSIAANHFRTEKTKTNLASAEFRISDFFQRRFFRWMYYYLINRFGFNHCYQVYPKGAGVFPLSREGTIRIGVVGDWATYTPQSVKIAERIKSHEPHHTIHIGDTYYVGAPHEIENNFTKEGAPWVKGKEGSFALLGNHEMYARGIAYFNSLLSIMGAKNKNGQMQRQEAAFFCLESDHWLILGLDTGYHSIGKIPLIEMIPWFAPDCCFDKKMMDWLGETLRAKDPDGKKALLILTHHQYISAFKGETEYTKPAIQLAEKIGKDRSVVWLWGHEHKFSLYAKAQVEEGVKAYGRCIGHGGMPVELKGFVMEEGKHGYNKLVMVDRRPIPGTDAYPLGYNGYAMLNLEGPTLGIEYYDIKGFLFAEHWKPDGKGGVSGNITKPATDIRIETYDNRPWEDAVD